MKEISSRQQIINQQTVKAQVKVAAEFKKKFSDKLHDLPFAEAISWNSEPGCTTLEEIYIDTGHNHAFKCPAKNLSPDVEKIVMEQVEAWLKDGTIFQV